MVCVCVCACVRGGGGEGVAVCLHKSIPDFAAILMQLFITCRAYNGSEEDKQIIRYIVAGRFS